MFGNMPLLAVLKQRMHYEQVRQKVLAENVANSDTPGYRPRDLTRFDQIISRAGREETTGSVAMMATQPGHIGGALTSSQDDIASRRAEVLETKPSGNAVSLEDEMMKVASNQADYQAAATLYSKSLAFLKIAIGKSA